MRKRTIAIYYIISIVMGAIGVGLIIAGLAGSTVATTGTSTYGTTGQIQNLGNPALFITGVVIAWLAAIPHLVAWIGALVALGRLQQWVWFVLMILFSSITLLVYLIAGPSILSLTQPRAAFPGAPPQSQPPQ
jgi:hypothetical protein